MKTTIYLILAFALTFAATSAQARLGETIEQCLVRYGKDVDNVGIKAPKKGYALLSFDKKDIRVTISFWDEVAVAITYYKLNVPPGSENVFSEKEILDLAELNKENSTWVRTKSSFISFNRADGKARGDYTGGHSVTFKRMQDGTSAQGDVKGSGL
ncbi:MAG TPA: hypothetical protein VK970_03645 [Candidatus Methylacidiphilales bacterium]|nr:hypothetical protein [Candidatus Methylacidiphilales bacterium]